MGLKSSIGAWKDTTGDSHALPSRSWENRETVKKLLYIIICQVKECEVKPFLRCHDALYFDQTTRDCESTGMTRNQQYSDHT